ncbi:MAG: hypothetical protein M3Q16_11115 [Pseudomonadota bacterium]|nr:hypothetical protein [Pseudomonadota bacterium]
MTVTDKVWEALATVINMNEKVISLSGTVRDQQTRIEHLTERVIKLEVTLELLMRASEMRKLN